MGEPTNMTTTLTNQRQQRPAWLNMDIPLVLSVICLVIIGLLFVFSSSWIYSLRLLKPVNYIFFRQLMWVGIGLGLALILAFFDYHHLRRVALWMMGFIVLALLVVLFNRGEEGYARTLFGSSVQPSEPAKLVLILYLAVWLNAKRDQIHQFSFGLMPILVMIGLIAGLIAVQPDLSAAATIVLLGVLLFILAGAELRHIVLMLIIISIVGWVVISIYPTGRQRIGEYIAGLKDPNSASFHVQRSMEAIARGGLLGVGMGKSDTKFTGLPVPWTDSIYAVIVEETGLVGGILVVLLYLLFLWRGLSISARAPDMLGKLLAGGITLWIVMEALLNIAVIVNLFPFTGNPLPFISFGGSNMTMTLAGVGVLMNIARKCQVVSEEEESKIFPSIVNINWRGLGRKDRRSQRKVNNANMRSHPGIQRQYVRNSDNATYGYETRSVKLVEQEKKPAPKVDAAAVTPATTTRAHSRPSTRPLIDLNGSVLGEIFGMRRRNRRRSVPRNDRSTSTRR
jgi:cell division protein FtsW